MKKNLLLTTALVALAMPAYAGQTIDAALTVVSDGSTNTISASEYKEYSREAGSGNARFGVIGYSDNKSLLQVIGGTFENNRNDYVGGVLATGLSGSLNVSGGSVFKNNHSYYDGGAIGNYGGLNISGATFEGNTAQLWGENYDEPVTDAEAVGGGAISLGSVSDTEIASITDTVFKNNISGKNGGAIGTRLGANGDNSAAKLNIDATFTGNEAHNNGGAIYNTFYANGGVNVKGIFEENTAGNNGGAIYNDGSKDNKGTGNPGGVMNILAGSKFTGNTSVVDGGAIYNTGEVSITKAVFENNKASVNSNADKGYGGAIFSIGRDVTIANSEFTGNTAYVSGAIHESKDSTGEMSITNSNFTSNHSAADGGAISISKKATIDTAVFTSNTAGLSEGGVTASTETNGGGAVFVAQKGNATLSNVEFYSNKSGAHGGAIATRHFANQGYVTLDTATFDGNEASEEGGAIASIYDGVIDITDSTFTNNKAGTEGGAIYIGKATNHAGNTSVESTNGGVLNLKGANVFTGNTANGKANDIYNSGTINVSGDLTLDGGVSGEGSIVFASGTNLTVQANKTTITNKVTNNGATLNMVFDTGFEGQYDLITETGSLDAEFTIADNTIYNIASVENGLYEITKKSSSEVAETLGASTEETEVLMSAISGSSNNQYFNDVADALNTAAQNGDASAVKEATKLGADANPIVSTQETGTHDVLFGVVSSELNGDSGAMAGMSSGDVFKKASAWIRGLFNKADHESTSKSSGFNADTYGVAMGIDKEINSDTRLGFGYANSQTDIESTGRDTDVDTNSFFVYSQYKPANWYVNTMLAYSWSEYDETKSVMGVNAGAKYDVDTIALQSMYGYETQFKGHNVTPELGFRYLHINQDAYTDKLGTAVAENAEDVLTLVAGAKVSKNYTLENGAVLRPELRAAVTYDLFDADNSANVALANGASYVVDGEKLNRLGFEFGAKVATNVTDKVEVSAGYLTRVREDYQDHTVTFDARYNF